MRELAIKLTSHVGRDLLAAAAAFKTEQAVVWEYVVNSLQYVDDGIAPRVNVLVMQKEKLIEISDNGRGMTDADLRRFFTMHAENIDRLRGRQGRGKFGTGKSAAFGIARALAVDTRRDGIRNKVLLTREAVDSSTGDDIPVEWVIRNEATELANGTTISIDRIELQRLLIAPIIEYIERHLQFFRAIAPEVAVNDHVCQYREPELDEAFEYRPTAEQATVLGDVVLRIKLSRAPLPESEIGVAVTAGVGALVAIETGGIERKEFGNYLFGEIDCPAIEQVKTSIEPYDPSRNLQLNVRHPICAVLIPFIASKLEEIRIARVRRLQEARKSEQSRRLEMEANRIAEVLNRDFEAVVSRLEGIRAASASSSTNAVSRFGKKGQAGDDTDAYVEGIQFPADIESTDLPRREGKRSADRNPPDLSRRAAVNADGKSAGDPAGGDGPRRRPRGGFHVAYRNLGEREGRSKYDPPTLTILINLDHPAIKNALAAGNDSIEDVGFRRLSYELAFTEYSLALGWEMANRDPDMPADDLLYEIRASLNRVSTAAAALYSRVH